MVQENSHKFFTSALITAQVQHSSDSTHDPQTLLEKNEIQNDFTDKFVSLKQKHSAY